MDAPQPVPSTTIELAPGVTVREDDLRFHFARSGGPGGQNVNKVNSKAELRVRPEALMGLSPGAVDRLKTAQRNRITTDGDLLLAADSSRSQCANRLACIEKLRGIVSAAIVEPKLRRKTRPSRGARERRLESKKAHSRIKAQRRRDDY